MSEHVAFCSANDRPVLVLLRADPLPAAHGDARELLCLEYGTRCTGAFCPMLCTDEDALQSAAPVGISSAGRPPLP